MKSVNHVNPLFNEMGPPVRGILKQVQDDFSYYFNFFTSTLKSAPTTGIFFHSVSGFFL